MDVEKLKPLRDGVLVRLQKPEERSAGGIIIPDVAQDPKRKPAQIGKVLAVGPGALTEQGERLPIEVRPGNTVVFARYTGTELEPDLHLISAGDILGVVAKVIGTTGGGAEILQDTE